MLLRLHSFTTRVVLTLLLSTAIPILGFGWFAQRGMQDRLEKQVVEVLLRGHASLVADRLQHLLDQVYRECAVIEADARVAIAGGLSQDEFRARLDLTPGFDRDFQRVLVAAGDGRVLLDVPSLELAESPRGARDPLRRDSVVDQPWFERLMRGDAELDAAVLWEDRHLSPFLHRSSDRVSLDPSDYSLGLAIRVVGHDGGIGVFYALLHWQRVQDIVDAARRLLHDGAQLGSAEAFLCDGRGVVLAASDRARYSEHVEPAALRDWVVGSGDPGVTSYVDGDGAPGLAGAARVDRAGLDWRCCVRAPTRELFAASAEFGRLLWILTGVIAVALLAWSWLASRRILEPVRTLGEATRRVARGDLDARVDVRGRDEIAELGTAFNAMAADLAQSRDRLLASERTAAWAEMARQVAHEIKNPLTPMRMSAQLLLKARREQDPRLPELVDRLAKTVVEQTENLARIASDFRHFAGRPEQKIELVEADQILADVGQDFAAFLEEGEASVVLQPGAHGACIRVDRLEMRRVFINLVQNALQACGERGEIVIASSLDDDKVVFTVRDDGPGIPPEVVPRLFEPYFTTRSSGTGLGLAICRRLIDAYGGTIVLQSSRPGETVFRAELAAWPKPPDATSTESMPPTGAPAS